MSDDAARPPFHLAFPVRDLAETRDFYERVLGCGVGRSAERWVDFDFFGHQISAHVAPEDLGEARTNQVDGDSVPVRHFGVVLEWKHWHRVVEKLLDAGVEPFIGPRIRFQGEPGEQATVFLRDPSGNAIELKSFRDPTLLFSRD